MKYALPLLALLACGTDTLGASSPARIRDNHSGYDASVPDSGTSDGGRNDAGTAPIIAEEEPALNIIVDTLHNNVYTLERQDGSWSVLLSDPEDGQYNLFLYPDLRFRAAETSAYSYLEFDSPEDPGVGFSSNLPFYRELPPDTEENLRRIVQEYRQQLERE